MSSSNKTEYIGLNSWAGTDRPERADFNSDNDLVDAALQAHFENADAHLTTDEREAWNAPYYSGMYLGNDSSKRTITTGCPFEAQFAIVFCNGTGAVSVDFENKISYNYMAMATGNSGMAGIELSGADIIVCQTSDAVGDYGCMSFNMAGSIYSYILFR